MIWLLLLAALNGFSLENLSVPRDSIVAGGPRRDGVHSVESPEFAPAAEARWVTGMTPVIGVALGGVARAYPTHLLEFHQVVNDTLADVPIAVTYDPLAGVPRAWRRKVDGKLLEFGVSGLIHNSNFILYDRQTESLWLQFDGRAIAGPLLGKRLEPLVVRQEILDLWLARHADSVVLRPPDPERHGYRYSPYRAYWVKDEIPFPVAAEDRSYHAKELVVGVVVDGVARAYLGSILTVAGGRAVDEIAGKRIQIDYDTNLGAFAWDVSNGVSVTEAYWFAWKAFHPDTDVWQPTRSSPEANTSPSSSNTSSPLEGRHPLGGCEYWSRVHAPASHGDLRSPARPRRLHRSRGPAPRAASVRRGGGGVPRGLELHGRAPGDRHRGLDSVHAAALGHDLVHGGGRRALRGGPEPGREALAGLGR